MESNSRKLNKLNYLLYFALFLFLFVSGIYFFNFNNGFSTDNGEWGTFGDFIGGTLNPLFALFSLFAIIYTIKIQTQELEYTREELQATKEELSKSRVAQEEQSEAFKIQNLSIKQQTFENTFFKMIDLYSNVVKGLGLKSDEKQRPMRTSSRYGQIKYVHKVGMVEIESDNTSYNSKEVIPRLLEIFIEYMKIIDKPKSQFKLQAGYYEDFHKAFENIIGHYFGTIYQLLKFIDTSKIEDKENYINLFRAQFSKDELELLFYHATSEIAIRKLTPLLIRYEFFEHLNIEKLSKGAIIKLIYKTKELNEQYPDNKLFGNNEKSKEKIQEIMQSFQMGNTDN